MDTFWYWMADALALGILWLWRQATATWEVEAWVMCAPAVVFGVFAWLWARSYRLQRQADERWVVSYLRGLAQDGEALTAQALVARAWGTITGLRDSLRLARNERDAAVEEAAVLRARLAKFDRRRDKKGRIIGAVKQSAPKRRIGGPRDAH